MTQPVGVPSSSVPGSGRMPSCSPPAATAPSPSTSRPSAVELARDRHPGSAVDYRVADLLDLPADLVGAFDLVVDVFTVQALPRPLRDGAVDGIRSLLAPGGELLAVQFVHEDDAPEDDGPPWLVTRAEMESFADDEVALVSLSRGPHPLRPGGPDTWVGLFRRAG